MNHLPLHITKRSRLLYIFQAAFEYLISLLVAGSFLATLTKELGFSDSLTGILSSVISLGCLFQLLSLSVRPKNEKRFVTTLSILNQLLFMTLYIIPLTNFQKQIKIGMFVILIFAAYIIYNFAHPRKINWYMTFVDDQHRGQFTANKEIISLVSGMIFSFAMGSLIDHFKATGEMRTAFIICTITICGLMFLHSLTMIFTANNPVPASSNQNLKQSLSELLKDKYLLQISLVFILYYVSTYISTPFYGTYQINELGLSLTFISVIVICGNITRILVSNFWGKYGDRNSFASMIEKCLIFAGLSHFCIAFAIPQNGAVMFVLYYIFHGIALGGINSAFINLIFDYVSTEKRADALAITQAFAGLAGFLATLIVSPIITSIQNNGNNILGLQIYAQQFFSVLSLLITIITILYIRKVFISNKPTC